MAALRVEFLRARARARRFSEEVKLLEEEQRRVLASLEANGTRWDAREKHAEDIGCPIIRQGAAAYAARQADLQRSLADMFRMMWKPAQQEHTNNLQTVDGKTDEDANDGELAFGYGADTDNDSEGDDSLVAFSDEEG